MAGRIKRFYEQAQVEIHEGYFTVELDGRPVKSTGMKIIKLPTLPLANLLCEEWNRQEQFIEPEKMPMMRFAGLVTDTIIPKPAAYRSEIVNYARSDLLCYRAEEPNSLVERQNRMWDPVLDLFRKKAGLSFVTTRGICHVTQNEDVITGVSERLVKPLEGYYLGAVHTIAKLTGSALLAIALSKGWLTHDKVWSLSHLDEDFQAETWGLDEQAKQRREGQYSDYVALSKVFLDQA